MKNILIFLVLLLSNIAYGQTNNLPIVVDNIAFFPPARNQQNVPNCSYFSVIYYLKSYEWNKHFNRNPKLEENQFSHSFAWNQNINPVYEMSEPYGAFSFMKEQGCATIADFPLTEESTEIKPSSEVREKAMAFKSKNLYHGDILNKDAAVYIKSLKDSLSKGKCFSLSYYPFASFFKLSNKNRVFSYYQGTSRDSILPAHMATVIGYNDTIKTASGKGAFEVLNSNTAVTSDGIFYLDYNWFSSGLCNFDTFFLEEDFNSNPDPALFLNLKLKNLVIDADKNEGRYMFTDTAFDSDGKRVDYLNYLDYIYRRNEIKLLAINIKKISVDDQARVFFPENSNDGSYQIIKDLSALSNIDNFKSLKVLFSDPISAAYVSEKNEIIYSYTREAKGIVDEAYINFAGTDKKIVAKIINLPDTTIVTENFFSYFIVWHWLTDDRPFPYGFVKSCTSVIKRQLITFSISDITDAVSNIEVPEYTLKAYPNPIINNVSVEFLLPKSETVKIVIYDYLGRQLQVIANKTYYAGENILDYDATNLISGVYIIKFEAGSFKKSIKVVKH